VSSVSRRSRSCQSRRNKRRDESGRASSASPRGHRTASSSSPANPTQRTPNESSPTSAAARTSESQRRCAHGTAGRGVAMDMDRDSVECLSLPDAAMDVDNVDGHPHHGHLGLPLHPAHLPSSGAGRAFPKVNAGGGGAGPAVAGAAGAAGAGGGPPATSVHELLECPVCTNSMFPPIHQVGAVLPVHRFQIGLRADLGISVGEGQDLYRGIELN
jgi:hypothetical protein